MISEKSLSLWLSKFYAASRFEARASVHFLSSSRVIGRPSSSIAAGMEVVLIQSGLFTIGLSITSAGSEGRPDGLNSVFRTSSSVFRTDLNWTFSGERIGEKLVFVHWFSSTFHKVNYGRLSWRRSWWRVSINDIYLVAFRFYCNSFCRCCGWWRCYVGWHVFYWSIVQFFDKASNSSLSE